jgi:hypothetical protein
MSLDHGSVNTYHNKKYFFSMWSMLYQTRVGKQFFPELLVLFGTVNIVAFIMN